MTEIKNSYCYLCNAECGIKVTLEDNKITKVVPDPSDPISQGYICEKSQLLIGHQYHTDRITSPLKKTASGFEKISWDQAFTEITEKLKTINRNKIFYMSSAWPNFEQYLYSELMTVLGAEYVTDVYSTEKMYQSFCETELFKGCNPIADIESSETLFIVGQNTWVTQHFPKARKILNQIKNDPTRNLIVVDPYKTKTAEMADYYVKINPGTNSWFLTALVKILVDNDFINKSFIDSHTINFSLLKSKLDKVDLTICLETCGVSYEQIFEVAKVIGSSNSMSVRAGNGVCHTLYSMNSHYLTILLYVLTGNINKTGGVHLSNDNISLGITNNHYFTKPNIPFSNKRQFSGITPAGSAVDCLEHFECVFIEESNPVGRFPNSEKLISNLKKMKLVVAMDSFNTLSTQHADYVLPTKTKFEKYNFSAPKFNSVILIEPLLENNNAKKIDNILTTILDKLKLIPNNKELKELYNQNFKMFIVNLHEKYNNRIPVVYQTLIDTLGKKYKTKYLAILWWKYFLIHRKSMLIDEAIGETNNIISLIEKTNYTGESNFKFNNDKINLTPILLMSTLKISAPQINNKNFILQCGYRNLDTVNNVIPNIRTPLLEISEQDAKMLSLKENEQIILETESISIELGYKIDSKLPIGLLRLQDHAIINKLTKTTNSNYFNPQYKQVSATIRKKHGISNTTD